MNWKIVWKRCKELIFPYAKRVSELEDVAEFWFNAYKVRGQEADKLRSENEKLQGELEEISASFDALYKKYEILLDCQKVKFAMSDPPACQDTKNAASNLSAANSDFWDSDWRDMTNGFKKWWDKLYHS